MLVGGFREVFNNISTICLGVGYESMSFFGGGNTAKGDLNQFYCILRKPYLWGIEVKNGTCYFNGAFIFLEIYKGKKL